MWTFFAIALSVYTLLHAYIYYSLRRWLGGGWWQLPVLLFFALMMAGFTLRRYLPESPFSVSLLTLSYYWLGFTIIVVTWLFAGDLARLAACGYNYCRGGQTSLLSAFSSGRAVPFLLLWSLILFGYAIYEARNVRVERVTVASALLPPGVEKLRIAAISDVHLSTLIGPKELQNLVNMVNAEQPDLIVSLGDLVDTNMDGRTKDSAILRTLKAPLGKYAILGNHEFYRGLEQSIRFTERSGLELLRCRTVEVGGISLVGVDDPVVPQELASAQCLRGADQNKFVLLLSHRPDVPEEALGLFDLQLSGHTHGGQIWPGIFFTRLTHSFWQGLTLLPPAAGQTNSPAKSSRLFLTNGAGYWGPPIRLWTPPEIVIIDLQAER